MAIQKVQITIANVNDGIVTGNQPTSPVNGELWLDSSVTPYPMLKEWNGTQWNNIGEMDATLSTSLNTINTQLNNMTDDGKLDFNERQQIKNDISNIIGYVITDATTTLPTTTTLDNSGSGSFYQVRKFAKNAGVSTSHADYVNVLTTYNALATYLQTLTPRPWDAGQVNKATVVTIDPTAFRQKFINYYSAEDVLRTTTSAQLQANVTNINIGGRNILLNTGLTTGDATNFALSNMITVDKSFLDGKYNSFEYNITGLSADVWSNANPTTVPCKAGDIFSASADVYIPTGSGIDSGTPTLEMQFFDSGGARISFPNQPTSIASLSTLDKWQTLYMENIVAPANTATVNARVWLQRNGHIWVAKLKLENGTKHTAWSPAPEDADGQISNIDSRLSLAETSIQPDVISATVISTDSFDQAISGKADSSDLGSYATQQDVTDAKNSANGYTDTAIKNQDFSDFVQSSTFTDTINSMNASFTKGGGVNLAKNSVGFAGTDMWTVSGAVNTVINDELTALGFLSGFQDNANTSGSLTQTIYTQIGQYYTISFYMRKDTDNATNGDLGINIYDATNTNLHFVGLAGGAGKTTGYTQYSYTFLANTATHNIVLTWGSATTGVITGVMVNIGVNALQWTMATGELYNANVKFDMNGITVSQTLNGIEQGRTVMTPTKFAGYYDVNNDGQIDEADGSPDEVFRVDKDEFVMKKATVTSEITMGNMKVVQIASGAINGWAFVKYTT
jgi:hypothetical protein